MLEKALSAQATPERLHALNIKKREYQDLVTNAAKATYIATQRKLYNVGKKAAKLLAWLDKRDQGDRWVLEIAQDAGPPVKDSKEIAATFADYYTQLYKKSVKMTAEDSRELLNDLPMSTLSESDRWTPDAALTLEGIEKDIQDMKVGKALGLNGIPIELYKLMPDTLVEKCGSMVRVAYPMQRSGPGPGFNSCLGGSWAQFPWT